MLPCLPSARTAAWPTAARPTAALPTAARPTPARPTPARTATALPTADMYGHDMTRLPYLRYDDLDDRGREVWDGVTGSRGGEVVNAEGGLIGPFNAFVHAPGVGRHLSALGGRLRFKTSIERRLSELAIITVGAAWRAEFEWWAHAGTARKHGVSDAVVDAIGRGDEPPFEAEDERAIYEVARQLTSTGRLSQETHDAARRFLGDQGMVELVYLCGYYTLISFLLNAFAVPLPPEARLQWGSIASEEANQSSPRTGAE
jgi:4-carboxymuconolactone decarboxylase